MWRTATVLLTLAAAAVPAPAAAKPFEGHAARTCPAAAQLGRHVTRLRVAGGSCGTATRLARAWTRRPGCDPQVPFIDRRCLVAGWSCRASRVAIVTTRRVSCSKRSARVRFLHRAE